MDKSIQAIQKQIDAASPILNEIAYLTPALTRPGYEGSSTTLGKRAYDKLSVSKIKEKINKWQYATKTVISTCYGSDSEHYRIFVQTIADNRGLYLDAKDDLAREVNDGRNALSSIIEAENLKAELPEIHTQTPSSTIEVNTPKVFISHASTDKVVIREFIDNILKNGLGLNDNNIVCTTFEWTTVEPGNSIPEYIKDNIESASVVLAMVSKAYQKSAVCQNEVGAAWALGNRPISVVLPDADFNELGWLFKLDKAIKINNSDSLNLLQETLCDRLGLKIMTSLHWSPCVKKFLDAIQDINMDNGVKEESAEMLDIHIVSPNSEALNHDRELFKLFDNEYNEERIRYCLNNLQTTSHYSDYDLTIWMGIVDWLGKTSNCFIEDEIQKSALNLLGTFKEIINFTADNFSPDYKNWSQEDDNNVSPDKWRQIHEARIYSWEPDVYDTVLFRRSEQVVLSCIKEKVPKVENAYKSFRLIVKRKLFI